MTLPTLPIFWPGSGSSPSGITPLGLYDDDDDFNDDAPKIASWVAMRLGYPIMQVELIDAQIYACLEEAISEYSSQVNEFNLRENMMVLQGTSTSGSISQKLIQGNALPFIIAISEQYGEVAGVGGMVDVKSGYIDSIPGQQEYDLQALWAAVSESGNRIEIRRVFHDRTPAISRGGFGFGDSTTGPNDGQNWLLGQFGWAGYDGGLNASGGGVTGQYLMMPIYETLLRTQAIEFNDIIRRSQYSFEIVNNKLKIFPVPVDVWDRVYFEYIVTTDRTKSTLYNATDKVSDYSNAPYTNIQYTFINDIGRNWIRKYTLALAKGSLGRILSKYESIPSPNNEVRMDGPMLRQEAEREKEVLWNQLRETLVETGRSKQMEKQQENEKNAEEILRHAPLLLYIG